MFDNIKENTLSLYTPFTRNPATAIGCLDYYETSKYYETLKSYILWQWKVWMMQTKLVRALTGRETTLIAEIGRRDEQLAEW